MKERTSSKRAFDEKVVKIVGLKKAIILQQIDYWVNVAQKSQTNYHDEFYWTYNTVEKWSEQFFWSNKTTERLLKELRKDDYIKVGNYNKLGFDRTLWYRVNHKKLDAEIQALKPLNKPETTAQNHSDKMTESIPSKCQNALRQNEEIHSPKMSEAIPKSSPESNTKSSPIKEEVISLPPRWESIDSFALDSEQYLGIYECLYLKKFNDIPSVDGNRREETELNLQYLRQVRGFDENKFTAELQCHLDKCESKRPEDIDFEGFIISLMF